jgi:murein DD-endopeptidase MepM/ murein hydrolase activator NlpD
LILISLLFYSVSGASAEETGFSWPISCTPGIDCVGTHFRIGYPDVDSTGLSYACGNPGYLGHQGTDIVVSSIDQGVHALAAADGVVRWINDGRFDRCPNDAEPDCNEQEKSELLSGSGKGATLGFNAGNFVVIEHQLGPTRYLTLYAHLGKGSLTVAPGQKIVRGQELGAVASSGNSQIPHLHFGVYKAEEGMFRPVDPWKGVCNTSSNGLWASAVPYRTVGSHTASPASTRSRDAEMYLQSRQRNMPKELYYW